MELNENRIYSGQGRQHNWLVIILLILVGLLLYSEAKDWLHDLYYEEAQPRAITARGALAEDEQSTITLFKMVSPSVVFITSLAPQMDFFNFRALEIPQGAGSGFIWDDNGYVVTNYHVMMNAQRAKVVLADGSVRTGLLVGTEPDKDVAVLKIDAPKSLLPPIPLGTSEKLEVGQKVYAIGNPFGFDQTLTTGIISGLGREIIAATKRPIQGVIQTDAAINPGNSGGPLLDSAGRVIGINTAILSPSGAYAGIGFAVPIDAVNRVVPQIIRAGAATKPGLGISIAEDHVTKRLGLEGVLIVSVMEDGAAERAGLRPTTRDENGRIIPGDVIVGIDGKPVKSTGDLFKILDGHEVGDILQLGIQRRDEGALQIKIQLQALP
jgi:S1-C subfamily serine protease